MTTDQMLDVADSEELSEQMAYDILDAAEAAGRPVRRPPTPAELQAKLEAAFRVRD